ncbi:MAG: hypothetical protein J5685_13105 [Clostridiales bacterium]|nr:hypothetical protein [Clostridiales bacterium]
MLRYISGISFITLAIIAVRHFASGKISKRIQYAMWILIPVYILISQFLRISICLPEAFKGNDILNGYEVTEAIPANETVTALPVQSRDAVHYHTEASSEVTHISIPLQRERAHISVSGIIKYIKLYLPIAYTVTTAVFAGTVLIYNAGFIFYCKKRRTLLGLDRGIGMTVFRIKNNGAPFLLGNKVYLKEPSDPEDVERFALIHESCHFRHGDWLWSAVRIAVLIINWYNPLIWYAYLLSGRDCELACDEEVLIRIGSDKRTEYGKALISAMAGMQNEKGIGFALTMNGRSKKLMKERLTNIKTANGKQRILPLIAAAVVLIFAVGCSLTDVTEGSSSDTTESSVTTEAPETETRQTETPVTVEEPESNVTQSQNVQLTLPDGHRVIFIAPSVFDDDPVQLSASCSTNVIYMTSNNYYVMMSMVNAIQESGNDCDDVPYNISLECTDLENGSAIKEGEGYELTFEGSFLEIGNRDCDSTGSVDIADNVTFYSVRTDDDSTGRDPSVPELATIFYNDYDRDSLRIEEIPDINEYIANADLRDISIVNDTVISAVATVNDNEITEIYFCEN